MWPPENDFCRPSTDSTGHTPELATVLVTHHLEELPATTTHAVLVTGGRILAAGPVHDILTTELVTECFDHPIEITHQDGRWSARGGAARREGRSSGSGPLAP